MLRELEPGCAFRSSRSVRSGHRDHVDRIIMIESTGAKRRWSISRAVPPFVVMEPPCCDPIGSPVFYSVPHSESKVPRAAM
jgi:hypothetical protein